MSRQAALHGFGEGTLNFRMKAYASEDLRVADHPGENIIGIITAKAITGYVISQDKPDAMTEGQIWIQTGQKNMVLLNALKHNAIILKPVRAYQYTDGELRVVPAYIFQNGAWADWFNGDVYVDGSVCVPHDTAVKPEESSALVGEGYIEMTLPANMAAEAYEIFGPIDLTRFHTIRTTTKIHSGGGCIAALFVSQEKETEYEDAEAAANTVLGDYVQHETTLDVSELTGRHYIHAGINNDNGTYTLLSIAHILHISLE